MLIRQVVQVLIVFGLVGVVSLFAFPSVGYACSCAPSTFEEMFERSDAVFNGRVIGIEMSGGYNHVRFDVQTVWKGPVQARQVVLTSPNSASCGVTFERGQGYLVYAYQKPGYLETDLCTRTALYVRAEEDRNLLGEGKPPADDPSESEPSEDKPQKWRTPDSVLWAFYVLAIGVALFLRKRI